MVKALIASLFIMYFSSAFAESVTAKETIKKNAVSDVQNKTLDHFFSQTQTMKAKFDQTLSNLYGKVMEQSKGTLTFVRPDKFVLAYQQPIEQHYISNGKTIWIYDVELEQVNIRAINKSLGESPALLLSGNKEIYQYYTVTDMNAVDAQEYNWVMLKAKTPEMAFEKILLAFDKEQLVQMTMYDNFGQITDLYFSDIALNQSFPRSYFEFQIPEGVDVIGSANE